MPNLNFEEAAEVQRRWLADREREMRDIQAQVVINDMPRPVRMFFNDLLVKPKFTSAKRIESGEDLFQHILSGIQEIYDVEATIAGGAVRDLATGNTNITKDIDIFIPMQLEDFEKNFDELGWKGLNVVPKPYVGIDGKNVGQGRAFSTSCGWPLDLVFMPQGFGWEQINKFPIHAQRCSWMLKTGLEVCRKAAEDHENKQFTIDPTITDRAQVEKLVKKAEEWIKRGYKGWKVVPPELKEWWEEPEAVTKGQREKEVKKAVGKNWVMWDDNFLERN